MKIASYNLNGIRAALRKGLLNWIQEYNPDIICFQELKAQTEQLDLGLFKKLGYNIYTDEAEKKGYSGVAILSKEKAIEITRGFGSALDNEGRLLRADFREFSLFSVYMPSGASGNQRQKLKLKWLTEFKSYFQSYMATNSRVIVAGDFNICHQSIDLHNPKANQKSPGFTVEEREWFSSFLDLGFVDSFRHLNPNSGYYSWWSLRAQTRQKNLGWRIDYQLISKTLQPQLREAYMLPEAMHSDHCPVAIEISN